MRVRSGGLAGFVPVAASGAMTSIGALLAFAIVCGGVLVLRRVREPLRKRPFRWLGSPIPPAQGVGVCWLLMVFLPWAAWLRLGVWCVLGLVVYIGYSHGRAAQVHVENK